MKSDNDDRDEENQMDLGKNNEFKKQCIKWWWFRPQQEIWNKNYKQIKKNFNVVDEDDVIKHNLSSIWKDKK